jgi:lysozyme family protein
MHDLDEALKYLLEEEGGWSNNPNDRGGKTMFGVTQNTYNSYRRLRNLPPQSVSKITQPEARDLYDTMYWKVAGCDKLPWPISYLAFDAAVNSGVIRAKKWVQQGLGVEVDGQVGPGTVKAAQAAVDSGDGETIYKIVSARSDFLADLVKGDFSQSTFLKGWWRRTLRVLSRALLSELN